MGLVLALPTNLSIYIRGHQVVKYDMLADVLTVKEARDIISDLDPEKLAAVNKDTLDKHILPLNKRTLCLK